MKLNEIYIFFTSAVVIFSISYQPVNCGMYFNGRELKECDSDEVCADNEQCTAGYCYTICAYEGSCGPNTTCTASNHESFCSCAPGTTGSPYEGGCTEICNDNGDCPDDEQCNDSKCVSACFTMCGDGASCVATKHQFTCTCPSGTTGNPEVQCTQMCNKSDECPDYERCDEEHLCIPVCMQYSRLCGKYTSCSVENHNRVCTCAEGTTGNIHTGCNKSCSTNDDCTDEDVCENNKCINACDVFKCGPRRRCWAIHHAIRCSEEGRPNYFIAPY